MTVGVTGVVSSTAPSPSPPSWSADMLVTPEQAALWLRNAPQRQLDGLKIRMFVKEMDEGRWRPEGTEWIVRDGALLDGNHRAYALMVHGKPQEMPVVVKD